ncbi:MAG: sigma E protease regulator RseP [Gammaproteobacteria bacterium]|nr:sigma E protease regulator RseP [Gammaproteobacteria bacterium]
MSGFLFSAAAFVLALGVLITVHEFGHYWVARKAGVKVLRFSIGFGKPLWTRRRGPDQTEFVLAAIPLGGYVKMLDEREGPVAPEELSRAFNRQPVGKRMAVVVAGPAFNLLFAVLAYWVLFIHGVPGVKPLLDAPEPDSPAAVAGIEAQDLVRAVDGKPMTTWEGALLALLEGTLDRKRLALDVESVDGRRRTVELDLSALEGQLGGEDLLDRLGLHPWRPRLPAVIERVTPDGAAAGAGLRAGDRIVRADGQAIADWDAWVKYVQARPEQSIAVQIERAGALMDVKLRPARVMLDDGVIGRIGAEVRVPPELGAELRTETRYGPLAALQQSLTKTWDMSILTLRTLGKMLVGEASLDNISGPISIAQYAGHSASIGLVSFLGFLAIVSISLGVLNLLPVPVLDGGHLMYYLIELFKGSPVSERIEILGQRVGIALLFALMSLALFNDFSRLLR